MAYLIHRPELNVPFVGPFDTEEAATMWQEADITKRGPTEYSVDLLVLPNEIEAVNQRE